MVSSGDLSPGRSEGFGLSLLSPSQPRGRAVGPSAPPSHTGLHFGVGVEMCSGVRFGVLLIF